MFFNGEPMAGKAETYMGSMVADSHVLKFVGPHAYPFLPADGFDKAAFGATAKNLIGSFPDLTFNYEKATPTKNADGSWSANIVVMGTHTGAAFTPMPGKLPPVETTNKCVKIGPETFTLWTDAEGKVVKTEIKPLGANHPHGPPGFYHEIGGKLPGAPPTPQGILDFYSGVTPTSKEAFADFFAPGAEVSFLGEFRPKTPDGGEVVIKQEAMAGVMGSLLEGFSDFTFNPEKNAFVQQPDGGWKAKILVTGTHSGSFSPMPGVPPIEATGKKCVMGPEYFTLYVNDEGKVTKKTVEPCQAGPSGPPGMYVLAGGTLG